MTYIILTEYLLDVMTYGGIGLTVTLPLSVKMAGKIMPQVAEHYVETVIIFFVLGVAAVMLVWQLQKIFRTVERRKCLVEANVVSLRKMGRLSYFIAIVAAVRSIVYMSVSMVVVILVFIVGGLFSSILANVFEEVVRYKEENDLTK